MRIVFVAPAASGLGGVGETADAVGFLSREVALLGHEVWLFVPGPSGFVGPSTTPLEQSPFLLRFHDGPETVEVRRASGGSAGVETFTVEIDPFAEAPGFEGRDGRPRADAVRRSAILVRGCLAAIESLGAGVDLVQCFDWPTALMAIHLRGGILGEDGASRTCSALAGVPVSLGWCAPGSRPIFSAFDAAAARVPRRFLPASSEEEGGELDLLCEGIRFADRILVLGWAGGEVAGERSHDLRFARELADRADVRLDLYPGIDPARWDPASDPALVAPFGAGAPAGKRRCKADLILEMELEPRIDRPLLALLAREGFPFDLAVEALPRWLDLGFGIVLLGPVADRRRHELQAICRRGAGRCVWRQDGGRDVLGKVLAGSDLLLAARPWAPFGGMVLEAHRYGAIPIVDSAAARAVYLESVGDVADHGTAFEVADGSEDALEVVLTGARDLFAAGESWAALRDRALAWQVPRASLARRYEAFVSGAVAAGPLTGRPSV
jgi:starch synthase